MPLEDIDLDSADFMAVPDLEESQLEQAISHSIEVNGLNAWKDHLDAAEACNPDLDLKYLSRTIARVIEDVI